MALHTAQDFKNQTLREGDFVHFRKAAKLHIGAIRSINHGTQPQNRILTIRSCTDGLLYKRVNRKVLKAIL